MPTINQWPPPTDLMETPLDDWYRVRIRGERSDLYLRSSDDPFNFNYDPYYRNRHEYRIEYWTRDVVSGTRFDYETMSYSRVDDSHRMEWFSLREELHGDAREYARNSDLDYDWREWRNYGTSVFEHDDVTELERCGDPYCECAERGGESPYSDHYGGYSNSDTVAHIHNYDYIPDGGFQFHGPPPLYYGMELEYDHEGYSSDRVLAAKCADDALGNLGFVKRDGSVEGFEIVTHPMAYEYAMDNFPWRMLREMGDYGCEAHHGTGIHVHVSRTGFDNELHTYRWLKFWYRNVSAIQELARRNSGEWARFTPGMRMAAKDHAKHRRNIDHVDSYGHRDTYRAPRYSAINVNPSDTFEVRVFRSTVVPRQAQAALGLVHGTVKYAAELNARAILKHRGWEWSTFAKWLKNESDTYEPLLAEIHDLRLA